MAGSTADILRGAASAASAGQSLDSNTVDRIDTGPDVGDISSATVDSEGVFRADESTVDGEGDQDPNDTRVGDSQSSKPGTKAVLGKEPKTEISTKEVITVSDDKGRRQVEIDWNNKDQLKKYVQMAFGARKWQAERDQARQSSTKTQAELGEVKGNWQKLEQAYQGRGIAGLIDLVEGQGAYDNHIKKVAERAKFMERASPEELEHLKQQDRVEELERKLQKEQSEREKFTKEITSEREAAELNSAQGKVYPVFSKYRFAEKLGDPTDEHMFDEMLWNTSMKRLEAYEEKGLDISPELVEREFRAVAGSIRKRIGLLAEKRATKVVDQKKREATENVQQRLISGYKSGNGASKEARELLNQGNTSALLKGWSKYGSFFGGNRK